MVLYEFIEQCLADINQRVAQQEEKFGADVVRAFCSIQWGFAPKGSKNPVFGANLLAGEFASLTKSSDTILKSLTEEMSALEKEYGVGFVSDIMKDRYDLQIGNPKFVQGGSFDGTDKGEQIRSPGTMYHLDTMVSDYSQNLRQEVLSNASQEALAYFPENLDYDPVRVVDAASLSEDMWHNMRQYSIGASAIAAISGSSPFENQLSLWHQKLGHDVLVEDSEEDQEFKERIFFWGHIAETYLRHVVPQKEEFKGCNVIVESMVFSVEDHPYLTCNLDAILEWPDGHYSVLEFKAPSPFSKEKFEDNAIPPYYEEQMQLQMAAVNLDDAYLVAMFNRDEITVSHTVRDLDFEMELIREARDFWFTNIVGEQEPIVNGPGEITKGTLRKYGGKGNNKAPAMSLDPIQFGQALKAAEEYNSRRAALDKQSRELKKQFEDEIAPVLVQMANSTYATCEDTGEGVRYSVKYTETTDSPKVKRSEMDRLQQENPALFQQLLPYISYSGGGRRLSMTATKIV